MMKTKRLMTRSMVAGLLMSAAFFLIAGPVTPTAEAAPRPEVRERSKTKKTTPKKKRSVKPAKKSSDRPQADRAREVRRPSKPKSDARRPAKSPRPEKSKGEVRRSNRSPGKAKAPAKVRRPSSPRRDDGRRGEFTPSPNGKNRREVGERRGSDGRHDPGRSRDGKIHRRDGRHDDRRDHRKGDHRRDVRHRKDHVDGRGHDTWHHRVERRRDYWHYVPRHWFPRFVRLAAHHHHPRHYRPWYAQARRIYIHDDPFYFHAQLGFYIGGLAIQLDLGNDPPWGYVYYDPYCDEVFWTLREYRRHLRWYDHQPLLTLIDAEYAGY